MKRIIVCLVLLSMMLFPAQPAKAFGPCDGTTSHAAPQIHDLWNTNRLVYETKASLNIVYTNTNAYLCHMTYDFQVTTSTGGWKFENLVCIGTCNNPHVVWSGTITVPNTACVWLDGSVHKSMECKVDVPAGATVKIQQIWQNSAVGGSDTSYYGLSGKDTGTTDYLILSGNDSIY